MHETELWRDVLHFFAADACPPLISIPRVSDDSKHAFAARLQAQFDLVPVSTVEQTIGDARFRSLNPELEGPELVRKAKEWHLIDRLSREIPLLRRRLLLENPGAERPRPYDHPALADVEVTADHLVPLREFQYYRGALTRSGFVFSMVPVTESVNASYWLTRSLVTSLRDQVFVRLDPLLISSLEGYRGLEYKMFVYGQPLDWDRLAGLKKEEHGRWQPEGRPRGVDFTDYVWTPRESEVHFRCEEVLAIDRALQWGCRYLHAVYRSDMRRIVHLDGALRFMTTQDLETRRKYHVRHAGKVGARVKVFRVDTPVAADRFAEITPQFFVWNDDVVRYFGSA